MSDQAPDQDKPCPFCGGTKLSMFSGPEGWAMHCDTCCARGPVSEADTDEEAIAMWNQTDGCRAMKNDVTFLVPLTSVDCELIKQALRSLRREARAGDCPLSPRQANARINTAFHVENKITDAMESGRIMP